MTPWARTGAAALVAATIGCARTLAPPEVAEDVVADHERAAADLAFTAYVAGVGRVLAVSERLRIANAEDCGERTQPYLGWFVRAERDVDRRLRELAASSLGVTRDPVVLALTPDSPAKAAGVRVRDEILALDGRAVRSAQQLARRVRDLPAGPVDVRLRRGDATLTLSARPIRACRPDVEPYLGDGLESPWQRGAFRPGPILVSLGLAAQATDDELAYVLALALANSALPDPPPGEPEPERDLELAERAVALSRRAGFSVDGVERLLELSARERPADVVHHDSKQPSIRVGHQRRYAAVVGPLPKRIVALRMARAARTE